METRTKILIAILALSFLGMAMFLVLQHGVPAEGLIPILLFGVFLVVAAIVSLKIEKKAFEGKSIPKIVIASFALAFALMLLVGVLALPFVGFEALETIMGHNAGIIWLVLAIFVSPITAKYLC